MKLNFKTAIDEAGWRLRKMSMLVHPAQWQSVDVSKMPEMATHEVLNYSFTVPVMTEDLDELREDIGPNLPWADDHFYERVGGEPLNPGEQWKHWPWGHSADRFRTQGGQFSHTYMERFWPRHAGLRDSKKDEHVGIRFRYGDLEDVLDLLIRDPLTRQAYVPIWFPEDTGVHHGERVPCTLGYHFIMRAGYLHVVYYIRSCDYVRHFRDDIYLTVRLLLWVLDSLSNAHSDWEKVKPGTLTMHITSLHLFRNDYIKLWRR